MGDSARRLSGSANGPESTTPRYLRPSELTMRSRDWDGASRTRSLASSTVTAMSSLPGPSKVVRLMTCGSGGLEAERRAGAGVGGRGHLAEAAAAVDRLADAVGHVDEHREAALLHQ